MLRTPRGCRNVTSNIESLEAIDLLLSVIVWCITSIFSSSMRGSLGLFRQDFYAAYRAVSPEEFERLWKTLFHSSILHSKIISIANFIHVMNSGLGHRQARSLQQVFVRQGVSSPKTASVRNLPSSSWCGCFTFCITHNLGYNSLLHIVRQKTTFSSNWRDTSQSTCAVCVQLSPYNGHRCVLRWRELQPSVLPLHLCGLHKVRI